MGWGSYLAVAMSHGVAEGSSPADPIAAAISQVLGYGVLGVAVIVLCWVLWKGSFVRASDARAEADARVEAARADLLRENERLRERLERTEAELREALAFIRDRLMPLLQQFVQSTSALLPILQRVTARYDESPSRGWEHDDERGRR